MKIKSTFLPLRWIALRCALMAVALAFATTSFAVPITIQITSDTDLSARAVITGSFSDMTWGASDKHAIAGGGYYMEQQATLAQVGNKWHINGIAYTDLFFDANDSFQGTGFGLDFLGQHFVGPHPGEANNGLTLDVYNLNLTGSTFRGQQLTDSLIHPGSAHHDLMTLAIDDLDPNSPSYLSRNEVSAVVNLDHSVPDTGTTFALLATALGALECMRKRRKLDS